MTQHHVIRIWDLPTRLFHWTLAAATIALVATAKLGGNAMLWHERLGYLMLALLVFRLAWGLVGGRWSRFASFLYSPARLLRYVRGGGQPHVDDVGHSPLGALSVFALLIVLVLQVASGLASDDEIAFTGPLARFLSGEWVGRATWYHADVGQYLIYGLVGLHLLAIAFYALVRRRRILRPMITGDKVLAEPVPASRDDGRMRALALVLVALAALLAWWVSRLDAGGGF
ncbi:cytochrome B [Melaminivora suipulveris]|uniref:Cytochrome B n=1 Tax=Melaminivora suipulveris TaxID=2109913 RepID=A0A2R3QBJ6_9BURK|nr:cytochrome b/b6 domain-containing protein [Melaminivora suipulveris]AVO49131.1 cytochrome B [Melaminivora suipulveris]